MTDSDVVSAIGNLWRRERVFLPILVLIATTVGLIVLRFRLDQAEGQFLTGMLVGALGAGTLTAAAFVIRLGTALRGCPPSGLITDAARLVRDRC